MKPEEKARQKIDNLLELAGWTIQDFDNLNLGASLGVIIQEFPLKTGPTDYLLFVDRKAVGVIEAKPKGTTLTGVNTHSDKYMGGLPDEIPHFEPLPFAYESTGSETLFRDIRDPDSRPRNVFAFHKPETLQEWANQEETLRCRLKKLPSLLVLIFKLFPVLSIFY
jgi:type I restriction enzyme, R subunit